MVFCRLTLNTSSKSLLLYLACPLCLEDSDFLNTLASAVFLSLLFADGSWLLFFFFLIPASHLLSHVDSSGIGMSLFPLQPSLFVFLFPPWGLSGSYFPATFQRQLYYGSHPNLNPIGWSFLIPQSKIDTLSHFLLLRIYSFSVYKLPLSKIHVFVSCLSLSVGSKLHDSSHFLVLSSGLIFVFRLCLTFSLPGNASLRQPLEHVLISFQFFAHKQVYKTSFSLPCIKQIPTSILITTYISPFLFKIYLY